MKRLVIASCVMLALSGAASAKDNEGGDTTTAGDTNPKANDATPIIQFSPSAIRSGCGR